MNTRFRQLRLRQLDATLARWQEAALPPRPATGWIRAIRDALGMSSEALARRLQVTGSAVRKLEEAEATDAITLGSLRRAAAALDCELQYALVPRQKLETTLQARALKVAQERVGTVAHSMALEDQAVDSSLTRSHIEEMANALIAKRTKDLW
ncbi:MAG: mobile mystery protein A [Pseudomonadota bacterium]